MLLFFICLGDHLDQYGNALEDHLRIYGCALPASNTLTITWRDANLVSLEDSSKISFQIKYVEVWVIIWSEGFLLLVITLLISEVDSDEVSFN